MILPANTAFNGETIHLPEGIEIVADDVILDGRGATLMGSSRTGAGIRITGRKNVTIRNIALLGYRYGILANGCENLHVENVHITATDEIEHNTIFLNIFHEPGEYPGGVLLQNTRSSYVKGCDLSHQFAGLLCYNCTDLQVQENTASYASGFGFYVSNTSNSQFTRNYADFCCRWHPREEGQGHMGADAAGFVIVNSSCGNTFERNFARLGGDGFFLAGLRHDLKFSPCNDNRFLHNDASWSPNISFEATFSSGNRFEGNLAKNSNYGFWLGFSRDNVLLANEIHNNRQAGIAVENGIDMQVRNNRLHGNGHGILLWSKRIPQFEPAVPENDTSRDWIIEENQFIANGIGIRIAADQDHGIRSFLQNGATPTPRNHQIKNNRFERNHKDIVKEGIQA